MLYGFFYSVAVRRCSLTAANAWGYNIGAHRKGMGYMPVGSEPMPLTDSAARNAKPTNRSWKLADEKGLYLLVHPNGSKYWRLKYRHHQFSHDQAADTAAFCLRCPAPSGVVDGQWRMV